MFQTETSKTENIPLDNNLDSNSNYRLYKERAFFVCRCFTAIHNGNGKSNLNESSY